MGEVYFQQNDKTKIGGNIKPRDPEDWGFVGLGKESGIYQRGFRGIIEILK